MSELSLTFFMLVGYAQAHWISIVLFMIGAIVLNYMAWDKTKSYIQMAYVKKTALATLALFGLLMVTIPWMTGSSLTMVNYWVDWTMLIVMAFGYSLAGISWLYPIIKLSPQNRAA
jgi:hypothetical protein